MSSLTPRLFDCRMYISGQGLITPILPKTTGPQRIIRLAAVEYDKLIEPTFRRLLVAFDSLP
jgi:hypothetical protein